MIGVGRGCCVVGQMKAIAVSKDLAVARAAAAVRSTSCFHSSRRCHGSRVHMPCQLFQNSHVVSFVPE